MHQGQDYQEQQSRPEAIRGKRLGQDVQQFNHILHLLYDAFSCRLSDNNYRHAAGFESRSHKAKMQHGVWTMGWRATTRNAQSLAPGKLYKALCLHS